MQTKYNPLLVSPCQAAGVQFAGVCKLCGLPSASYERSGESKQPCSNAEGRGVWNFRVKGRLFHGRDEMNTRADSAIVRMISGLWEKAVSAKGSAQSKVNKLSRQIPQQPRVVIVTS
ncbi:hypothetical protein ONS95_015047 [Cadophora gregata]|uniref:uncharacterized protein n=1 Tax=Cadophora gregata TaxID=51156 RepID=UPI0026DB7F04|nr:uncharacterized protein ONS95_015047 [Cadophora gregata]KAK0126454.1 hypothetical protein ONS95_015047 [Cadophora gregata]